MDLSPLSSQMRPQPKLASLFQSCKTLKQRNQLSYAQLLTTETLSSNKCVHHFKPLNLG